MSVRKDISVQKTLDSPPLPADFHLPSCSEKKILEDVLGNFLRNRPKKYELVLKKS